MVPRTNIKSFSLRVAVFVFLFSFVSFEAIGQFKLKDIDFSISLNESLSHTGFNSGLTANFKYKKLEVYVGPEMSLSDSYFAEDPRLGCTLGGRFYTNSAEKSSSYVFLNYQRTYYRPYLEELYESNKFNTTSELTIGLGQDWKLYKNLHLGASMGYGKYFDVFQDLSEGKVAHFDDGTILLRFSTTYKF